MRLFLLALLVIPWGCDTVPDKTETTSTVLLDSFDSELLGREVQYHVYLPEVYDQVSSLPIIYLLHGHGGDHNDWVESGEGNVQWLLDSLISGNQIPPVMAVTLNGKNTWYVDRHDKMESAYIQEFIPLIESKFKVDAKQASRLIAGFSAGGYGSLRMALKYSDLFRSAILLSPAAYYPVPPEISSSRKIDVFKIDSVFNDELWQSYAYPGLLEQFLESNSPTNFYLSSGDDDKYEIVTVVTQLREFFMENGIPQELRIIDGDHTWDVVKFCFAADLTRVFEGHDQGSP